MAERTVPEPFYEAARQGDANRFGMLIFLSSELLLFGGIFAAAMALRLLHPAEYIEASSHMKLWHGTLNTAILLTSSLFAALAVEAAREGKPEWVGRALWIAIALGLAFLAVKGHEYWIEYQEGVVPGTAHAHFASRFEALFMNFYFVGTGLHAFHVTAGLVLMAVAAAAPSARRDRRAILVGNVALYWHFVDIVWIFLYPTIYLAGVQ